MESIRTSSLRPVGNVLTLLDSQQQQTSTLSAQDFVSAMKAQGIVLVSLPMTDVVGVRLIFPVPPLSSLPLCPGAESQ